MSGRAGSNMGFDAKGSFGFATAESAMRAFDQKSGAISCKDTRAHPFPGSAEHHAGVRHRFERARPR